MEYNRKELNKIVHDIYELWKVRFNKMYADTDWSNVFSFINALECLYGIDSVNVSNGKYYNYFNENKSPYRQYDIKVLTKFGTLSGNIICCAAGSVDDPFSMYGITVNISPDGNPDK